MDCNFPKIVKRVSIVNPIVYNVIRYPALNPSVAIQIIEKNTDHNLSLCLKYSISSASKFLLLFFTGDNISNMIMSRIEITAAPCQLKFISVAKRDKKITAQENRQHPILVLAWKPPVLRRNIQNTAKIIANSKNLFVHNAITKQDVQCKAFNSVVSTPNLYTSTSSTSIESFSINFSNILLTNISLTFFTIFSFF